MPVFGAVVTAKPTATLNRAFSTYQGPFFRGDVGGASTGGSIALASTPGELALAGFHLATEDVGLEPDEGSVEHDAAQDGQLASDFVQFVTQFSDFTFQ